MKTVVLVDHEKAAWVKRISGEVAVVHTITEAEGHFNGAAPRVLVVSAKVAGAGGFVKELRRKGYHDTHVIAAADGYSERAAVMDTGCSCVVIRRVVPLSVAAFLALA